MHTVNPFLHGKQQLGELMVPSDLLPLKQSTPGLRASLVIFSTKGHLDSLPTQRHRLDPDGAIKQHVPYSSVPDSLNYTW